MMAVSVEVEGGEAPSAFSYDDFEDFCIDSRQQGAGPEGAARKRRSLLKFMESEFGLDVARFTASLEGAEAERRRVMAAAGRAGKGKSAQGNYVRVMVALADYAGLKDFKAKIPKPEDPEIRTYDREEWKALMAFRFPRNRFAEKQIRALFQAAYTTAMRPGEVQFLALRDLDQANSRIFIRYPEKGGRRRWVPVEPEFWSPKRPFMAWLREREKLALRDDWVWCNLKKTGGRYNRSTAASHRRWLNKYVEPATGVDAEMHRFRHTRAVALKRANFDIMHIKEVLGHRKLETTFHYLRALVGDLGEAFRGVNMPGLHDAARDQW